MRYYLRIFFWAALLNGVLAEMAFNKGEPQGPMERAYVLVALVVGTVGLAVMFFLGEKRRNGGLAEASPPVGKESRLPAEKAESSG
jgi:hypothetical protein